jgi:hypothetical protein
MRINVYSQECIIRRKLATALANMAMKVLMAAPETGLD